MTTATRRIRIDNILSAVDFSEHSDQASAYAVSLARWCGASLTLLHAFQSLPWYGVPRAGSVSAEPIPVPSESDVPILVDPPARQMAQDRSAGRGHALAAVAVVETLEAVEQPHGHGRGDRQQAVLAPYSAAADRHRADRPGARCERIDQEGRGDDIGDRIPRAHLVERDVLDGLAVDPGFGLGEMGEDGNGVGANRRRKVALFELGL